jgi:hypothetical protein
VDLIGSDRIVGNGSTNISGLSEASPTDYCFVLRSIISAIDTYALQSTTSQALEALSQSPSLFLHRLVSSKAEKQLFQNASLLYFSFNLREQSGDRRMHRKFKTRSIELRGALRCSLLWRNAHDSENMAPLSFAICHCHLPFVICHLPFAIAIAMPSHERSRTDAIQAHDDEAAAAEIPSFPPIRAC